MFPLNIGHFKSTDWHDIWNCISRLQFVMQDMSKACPQAGFFLCFDKRCGIPGLAMCNSGLQGQTATQELAEENGPL
jgi:hypothetical protein